MNVVIDPFYVLRTPFLKIQPQINDRFAKIESLRRRTDRFNSYIMGSSRMYGTPPGAIEKYIAGSKFYNLATIFATMSEHVLHVKYLVRNGYPVKNLYIGLDFDVYSTVRMHEETNCLLKLHPRVTNESTIAFYWSYIGILSKGDIKRKLRANFGKKGTSSVEIKPDGTLASGPDPENPGLFVEMPMNIDRIGTKNGSMKGNLESLKELVALCRQYDIHLHLFITPYHRRLMDHFVPQDYLTFLKELSEITAFWDFSGYNSVTTDNRNYLDHSHYNLRVSRLIAARIFDDKTLAVPEDFGVRVTRENIDTHIDHSQNRFW